MSLSSLAYAARLFAPVWKRQASAYSRTLARRYAGPLFASAAGAAWRKRKPGPVMSRPSKKAKTGGNAIAGRPSNDDTRINLNSTYNAVSLYNKRSKKSKYKSRRPKTFAGKVKKVLDKQPQSSTWTIAFTNQETNIAAPLANYATHDLWGGTTYAFLVGSGQKQDTTAVAKDLTHIYIKLRNYGHIESSAIVSDAARNVDWVKFWFSAKHQFDIQCFNVEFTDTNPLYADIYECTAAQNITDSNYSNPYSAWINACIDQNAAFSGDTIAVATTKGKTPKQSKLFNKYWSVNKVTRIRISNAAPFHYDMYTSGVYNANVAADAYCLKGITKGIFLVLAPIMTTTLPATYNIQLTAVNKQFKYKCLPFAGHQPSLDMQHGETKTTL